MLNKIITYLLKRKLKRELQKENYNEEEIEKILNNKNGIKTR